MAGFLEPLDLRDMGHRRWKVLRDLEYCVGSPESRVVVRVPYGTITDLASIPRFLWAVLPPIGSYDRAAVVHDYLYTTRRVYVFPRYLELALRRYKCTRLEADSILYEAMKVSGTSWPVRWAIYLGVRIGGWAAWDSHRMKEYPSARR